MKLIFPLIGLFSTLTPFIELSAASWAPEALDIIQIIRIGDQPVTKEEILALGEATPPGVMARVRTSPFHPVQLPDLIGVKDRRHLDHTGLVRQRSLGDLMRYSAMNQDGDGLSSFGGFIADAEGLSHAAAARRRRALQRRTTLRAGALIAFLKTL